MNKPTRLSRRSFLQTLAASSAALALEPLLAACARQTATPGLSTPPPVGELVPGGPDRPEATAAQPASAAPAGEALPAPTEPATLAIEPAGPGIAQADLAVLHVDLIRETDLALDWVTRLLQPLGGIEHFVAQGTRVVIKPNICTGYYTYEYAATTNPYVIGALVSLCLGAGAKHVQVMDFPFGGTAQAAYVKSGIQEQVEAAGGEMVIMTSMKYVDTEIPLGMDIQKWRIYEDILTADTLINVPIAKHHSLARLTLGMKNLMGTVLDREGLHRNLGQRLADLASRVKPALTVIDATRMLMANGPTGGKLDDVQAAGTLIASADILAADTYGASLFDMQPADLAYLSAGAAMGLGQTDLTQLKIEEINYY